MLQYRGPVATHESQVAEQRTGTLISDALQEAARCAAHIPDPGRRGRFLFALDIASAFLHGEEAPEPPPGLFGEVDDATVHGQET